MEQELNPLFAHFAGEVKRLRVRRGWSQEALGKRIGFSGEMVSKVETGRNAPSPDFADGLDLHAFPELEGVFKELLDRAGEWQFRTYAEAEQGAEVIRIWNPLLVPGLGQTARYARTVLDSWRAIDGDQKVEDALVARLERQQILGRDLPPSVQMILDESVLYRNVGGAEVMLEELQYLLELSERPRVTIRVLPVGADTLAGNMGALSILSFPGESIGMVYLETADYGETTRNPRRIARNTLTYETIQSEALSARASRELIRKVASETWTLKVIPSGAKALTAADPTPSA